MKSNLYLKFILGLARYTSIISEKEKGKKKKEGRKKIEV